MSKYREALVIKQREAKNQVKWRCPICRIEVPYKGYICSSCCNTRQDEVNIYKQKLELKRKYTRGEKITSLEELLKQEWVWWLSKPRHIEVIASQQLRTILNFLKRGHFYKAIKKEKKNERR